MCGAPGTSVVVMEQAFRRRRVPAAALGDCATVR
jgi:hypothetical protein